MEKVNFKVKMKLKCIDCGSINKHVVSKVRNKNNLVDFKVRCTHCKEENCVTEDKLLEMQENVGGNR